MMALSQEFSKADNASFNGMDLSDAFKRSSDTDALGAVTRIAKAFENEAALKAGEFRDSGDLTVLAGYVGHSAAMAAIVMNQEQTKEEKKRAEDAAFKAQIAALQEQIAALEAQIDDLEEDIAGYKKEITKLEKEIEAIDEIIELMVVGEWDPAQYPDLLAQSGLSENDDLEDAMRKRGDFSKKKTKLEKDLEKSVEDKDVLEKEIEGSRATLDRLEKSQSTSETNDIVSQKVSTIAGIGELNLVFAEASEELAVSILEAREVGYDAEVVKANIDADSFFAEGKMLEIDKQTIKPMQLD